MVKDINSENYEILMKEIKDDRDGGIYHVLGLDESILLKWLYYPKQSPGWIQSLSNYKAFFTEIEQKNVSFVWKHKISQIAKAT